jgi:putative transport protein
MATIDILLNNHLVTLFAIISLGILLGKARVAGISLGNSAIIFVALLFGHFHYTIPEGIGTLGLVLFIYCVGIGAGPNFFSAFAKQGATMAQLSFLIVGFASFLTYLLIKFFHVPMDLSIGLFAGALTSTPALAAAIDTLKEAGPLVSVGYGIAYPFGVIGIVLFAQVLPRMLRQDLEKLAGQTACIQGHNIQRYYVEVMNPSLFGKVIADTEVVAKFSCQISRTFDGTRFIPLQADTTFHKGQTVLLVGEKNNAASVIDFLGRLSTEVKDFEIESQRVEVVVTSPEMVGKTLRELDLIKEFGVTAVRLNRMEIVFVPTKDTMVEQADRLTVVGNDEGLNRFAKAAGHRSKALHETDLLSLSIGVLLGVTVGMVPFGLPGTKTVTLGLSGGLLLVALVLGHYGRVGKVVGRVPSAAQYLMRELGLIFFLAHAGVKAGGEFFGIVQQHGLILFFFGGLLTLLPMAGGCLVAVHIFKLNLLQTLGGLCGAMTSTPGLGTITARTDSEIPIISYAAAYPVALVSKIIFIQLLAALG